ncbi:MAG: T9SS type A sorting domain-containing protein, partial [Bacteroidales bacterium]
WRYSKDVNVIAGSDKAWVDYIVWPPYSDLLLVANAGADGYVCMPSAYQLQASVINAGNLFWTTAGDGYFDNTNIPNATYTPGVYDQNTGSVVLTIQAGSPTAQSVTDQMLLNIYQAPSAMAGMDASICSGNTFTVSGASASNQGLLWSTNGDGTFNSNSILSPIYTPGATDIINGHVTLILTGFGTGSCGNASDSLLLTINPSVSSNAGPDQSIPYGTSTLLGGQASGGTGNYIIAWTPADKLTVSNILNPATIVLTNSVEFLLQITDPATLCSAIDNVFVDVSGSPLSVSISASPERICVGGSSQLNAYAGGGTGNYTYSWSSVPSGFSSVIANPMVNPVITTIYSVVVSDGSNSLQASTTLTVDSIATKPPRPSGSTMVNPLINPETIYTTSNSANPIDYSWILIPQQAGSVTHQDNTCTITWDPEYNGISELKVAAINTCGTGVFSEALSINTSPFIGLPELQSNNLIEVWPNPVNEILYFKSPKLAMRQYSLYNSEGKAICKFDTEVGKDEITSINMKPYSPGIYFLHVKFGNTMVLHKIIKH